MIDISFLAFLLLLSALFSASEVAFISLSDAKVASLVANKYTNAKIINKLKERPQRLLITILIGNNLVNISAATYSTIVVGKILTNSSTGETLAIATGIMTLAILIFGEIIPKSFAQRWNVQFARLLAWPIYTLEILLLPIIWILEKFTTKMMQIAGVNQQIDVSEAEILALVSQGRASGNIEKQEHKYIENILDFTDMSVSSIMTPRTDIQALSDEDTLDQAKQFCRDTRHSRIPIYNESVDNITHIISVHRILQLLDTHKPTTKLKNVELHKAIYIPKTSILSNVFEQMRKRHVHMMIVVDEFGGTDGIVTMEDALEEIVGEIIDEKEVKIENNMQKIGKSELVVDGKVSISDIEEELNIQINSISDDDKNKPISLFILEKIRHMPSEGEKISLEEIDIIVENTDERKINQVKIYKKSYISAE